MTILKKSIVLTIILTIYTASMLWAQSVTITDIKKNDRILGKVSGLTGNQTSKFKVIVYAYTDIWYIHPYVGGGEGDSYSLLDKDGNWSLKTIKRRFNANGVAALLVPRDYTPPSKIDDLSRIKYIGRPYVMFLSPDPFSPGNHLIARQGLYGRI